MKIIDLTLDFETCGLSPNAAIMQIAAVPWDRYAETNPFLDSNNFNCGVDLRYCLMDGFEFDKPTCKWWAENAEKVKSSVVDELEPYPLEDAVRALCSYISDLKQSHKADEVCIWAQGSDFDLAILRNVCMFYNIEMPCSFHNFRDARTFILEVGSVAYNVPYEETVSDNGFLYSFIPSIDKTLNVSSPAPAHNALNDCINTTWNVYNVLKEIYNLNSADVLPGI